MNVVYKEGRRANDGDGGSHRFYSRREEEKRVTV